MQVRLFHFTEQGICHFHKVLPGPVYQHPRGCLEAISERCVLSRGKGCQNTNLLVTRGATRDSCFDR
jgi:hypothetical protein